MKTRSAFDRLWACAAAGKPAVSEASPAGLPEPARRYLGHAVAPGARLATAVRLRMHGEIKIGRWRPFTADEVICWPRGMIWRARVRMMGLPVTGFDRLVDGEAAQRWRFLGIVPVAAAAGPDIARSAAGRLAAEAVWLPTVFPRDAVRWRAIDGERAAARLSVQGHDVATTVSVDRVGRLASVSVRRWGSPDDRRFRLLAFGGVAEEERTFGAYTIPTRLRVGWHFGTPSFETEGEFFRVSIDEAAYR